MKISPISCRGHLCTYSWRFSCLQLSFFLQSVFVLRRTLAVRKARAVSRKVPWNNYKQRSSTVNRKLPTVHKFSCILPYTLAPCARTNESQQLTVRKVPGLPTEADSGCLLMAGKQGLLTTAWKQLLSYGVGPSNDNTSRLFQILKKWLPSRQFPVEVPGQYLSPAGTDERILQALKRLAWGSAMDAQGWSHEMWALCRRRAWPWGRGSHLGLLSYSVVQKCCRESHQTDCGPNGPPENCSQDLFGRIPPTTANRGRASSACSHDGQVVPPKWPPQSGPSAGGLQRHSICSHRHSKCI